jgi:hypothetical protein
MSRVFTSDVTAIAKRMGMTLEQTVRGVQIKLFNGVIMDTRVDTGRLRGNWQTSVGNPILQSIERLDTAGTAAMAQVQSTVTVGDVVYLTNNLPYAQVWEERDGMIARNVARLDRTIREASRDVSAQG